MDYHRIADKMIIVPCKTLIAIMSALHTRFHIPTTH